MKRLLCLTLSVILLFSACTQYHWIPLPGGDDINTSIPEPSDLEAGSSIDYGQLVKDVLNNGSGLKISWSETDPDVSGLSNVLSSRADIPEQKIIYADVSFDNYTSAITNTRVLSYINGGRLIFSFAYTLNGSMAEFTSYSVKTIEKPVLVCNDSSNSEKKLQYDASNGVVEATAEISTGGSVSISNVVITAITVPAGAVTVGSTEFDVEDIQPSSLGVTLGFDGGSGTAENPIPIADSEDLKHLSDLVNGTAEGFEAMSMAGMYFSQTADIDLSETEWIPIGGVGSTSGSTIRNPFMGSYNGNNHKISNLNMNSDEYMFGGLFGVVNGGEEGTSFKNIIITGTIDLTKPSSSVKSSACTAGFVAGTASGKIAFENCYTGSEDTVSSITAERAGGILGEAEGKSSSDITITNCYNWADVTARRDDGSKAEAYGGGIVGSTQNSEITNCENYGDVNGSSFAAGIAAYVISANISESNNYGTIEGNGSYNAGGIASAISKGTITDCINYASVSSTAGRVGGIAGLAENKSVIESCSVNKNAEEEVIITGTSQVGGIVGYLDSGSQIKGNSENKADSVIANGGSVGGIVGSVQNNSSVENADNYAFVGYESTLSSQVEHIGGIAGSISTGNVSACENHGNIGVENLTQSYKTGGIVGSISTHSSQQEYDISGCINYGKVYGSWQTGGICGFLNGGSKITDSGNFGSVIANRSNTGGIVGEIGPDGIVVNSDNSAAITGASSTGGIVGSAENAEIQNCNLLAGESTSATVVSGTGSLGGIAGLAVSTEISDSSTDENTSVNGSSGANGVGGIVGKIQNASKITKSINKSPVSGMYNVGGIVGILSYTPDYSGEPVSITGSENSGNINETSGYKASYVGGIAGSVYEAVSIDSCINHATVFNQYVKGGIIGNVSANDEYTEAIRNAKITVSNCENESTYGLIGDRTAFPEDSSEKIEITP